jgi:hypothetical protein
MRLAVATLLASLVLTGLASAAPPDADAMRHRNDAQWAEQEAQARITDGDYDGAVQAQQQADTEWQLAERDTNRAVRH